MPLHYTKSGGLDMRYSSSRAEVASGYSASGGSSGSVSSSGGSSSSAVSSQSYSSGSTSSSMNYKKDGSLDMRYASSRTAVASGYADSSGYTSVSSSLYSPATTVSHSGSDKGKDLHYKKDGSLDMRFASSKDAISENFEKMSLHHKKDDTLDMRYASSKGVGIGLQKNVPTGVPRHIPVTKKGLPDMRTSAAKNWVQEQAKSCQDGGHYLPTWIPRTKDGSIDFSKAVTAEYFKSNGYPTLKDSSFYDPHHRENYYKGRNEEAAYRQLVDNIRNTTVEVPQHSLLKNTTRIREELISSHVEIDPSFGVQAATIPLITDKELTLTSKELGRGAFGVVTQGTWKGLNVAVKRLHLQKLSKNEKISFIKEIKILATLGAHANLVTLHGYMVDPPTMVLEFVHLGSLNYLLHYNEDSELEAKMTDGRIKKRIVIGIINGMQQIHGVNIVHGDLKPQNILISKEFEAKITDFGLATLRGKTSSSVESSVTADGDVVVGGTAGYMAPELLDCTSPPELSSDVYSFGVVLNEIIQEEEPYSDQFRNFLGRGPFAAANYAKLGKRPRINSGTPGGLQTLIEKCWAVNWKLRPTFDKIFYETYEIKFPNSF